MIHLTCDNCHTVYQLDATQLGAGGRMVRCGQCKTMWFQDPVEDPDAPPPIELDMGDDDDIGMQDAAPAFAPDDDLPPLQEKTAADDQPDWLRADEPPAEDLDFRPAKKGEYVNEDNIELPEGLMQPFAPLQIPVMTHRPMGMGAAQFGLFTFLLLAFSSMLALVALRGVIMHHAPVMDAFYRPIGLGVKAPGEGLKLSGMTAQDQASSTGGDTAQHTLSVTAQLTNTTQGALSWPHFSIEALDAGGTVLKHWDSAATPEGGEDETQTVAAGVTLPMTLSFSDAPATAQRVRITAVP